MQRRHFLQKLILAASTFGLASLPYGIARLLVPGEATKFSNHYVHREHWLTMMNLLMHVLAVGYVVKYARQNV